jgi:hypothetical protein
MGEWNLEGAKREKKLNGQRNVTDDVEFVEDKDSDFSRFVSA